MILTVSANQYDHFQRRGCSMHRHRNVHWRSPHGKNNRGCHVKLSYHEILLSTIKYEIIKHKTKYDILSYFTRLTQQMAAQSGRVPRYKKRCSLDVTKYLSRERIDEVHYGLSSQVLLSPTARKNMRPGVRNNFFKK